MKKRDKNIITVLLSTLVVLIIAGMFIPITVNAPSDTRTILDHTTHTYASPSCFDSADMTNFLQETTYGHAQSLDYEAESSCSQEFYTQSDVPLLLAVFQLVGIGEQKWTEEDRL